MEELLLANGRALLAALYHGSFRINGELRNRDLSSFHELENLNALPLRLEWLDPAKVRTRPGNKYNPAPAHRLERIMQNDALGEHKPFVWKVFPME
jgi:hypothetical protein